MTLISRFLTPPLSTRARSPSFAFLRGFYLVRMITLLQAIDMLALLACGDHDAGSLGVDYL